MQIGRHVEIILKNNVLKAVEAEGLILEMEVEKTT